MKQCITVRQLTARYPFVMYYSCALFLHISLLHSFHVAPFLVLFHVALASFRTFFVLHSFRVWLYLCCTFSYGSLFKLHFFRAAPFLCAALILHLFLRCFMLHSLHVGLFYVALFRVALFLYCTLFKFHFYCVVHLSCCTFPCCTFLILHYFWVVIFSCCTHFVLHFFRVALFSCCALFMSLHFSCCAVFVLYLLCTHFMSYFFRVAHFSCKSFSVLNFFHVELFSCCTFVMLHRFHVAPFLFVALLSCCNLLMLHFLGIQASNVIKKRLHHRCFPVKFVTFLRTYLLENSCERPFQKIFTNKLSQCQSLTLYYREWMDSSYSSH